VQSRLGVVVPVLLGVLTGCGAAESSLGPTAGSAEPSPWGVLRDWDDARAEAWAAADVGALRALYLPASQAGVRDVRALQAYADRGLRVTGIRWQRLSARVLARQEALLRVEVVERLVGASVAHGSVVRRLPVGQPSRRVIELRYVDGTWRVGRVLPVTR